MLLERSSTDSFALSPELRSGLPSPLRSSLSCAVESLRSLPACLSEFSERFPPETDWLADLSESVQVLIDEQRPSAQSWALIVFSPPPPPPPQPAARTASTSSDPR